MRRTKSPQSPAFAPKAAYSARASASVNVNDVLNRSGPAANPVAGSASPMVVMARTRANRILDIETSCLSARDVLSGSEPLDATLRITSGGADPGKPSKFSGRVASSGSPATPLFDACDRPESSGSRLVRLRELVDACRQVEVSLRDAALRVRGQAERHLPVVSDRDVGVVVARFRLGRDGIHEGDGVVPIAPLE